MYRHDIDIKIIKHWLVLLHTCCITSYFTEGEIRFATLYFACMYINMLCPEYIIFNSALWSLPLIVCLSQKYPSGKIRIVQNTYFPS